MNLAVEVIGGAVAAVIFVRLIMAPYRMAKEDAAEIARLKARIAQLEQWGRSQSSDTPETQQEMSLQHWYELQSLNK